MATYGRGQMLGSGINPESFKLDYGGMANAAAMQAQGVSNLGQSIGNAISMVGEENKQINQNIAKGKSALQFAKANYPELARRIDEIGKIFSDPNVSKVEQAAAGSQMGEFVTAMIRGQEFNTEVGLKERALKIQEAENIAELAAKNREIQAKLDQRISDSIFIGGRDVAVTKDGFGNIYDPDTDRLITDQVAFAIGSNDFGPVTNQSNQDTGDLLQQSLDLNNPDLVTGGASNALFPDGVIPQGNPMPEGTPTTTATPKIDGVPAPRGIPRTTGAEKRGRVVSVDELNEFTKQGFKFNAIPNEDGTYTVTDITPAASSSDTINRNIKAYEAAGSLYEAGDRLGALNILRALKARDIYGDITDQTLDEYMKTYSSTTPSSTETTPSQDIEQSSDVVLFDSLTTEQKKKYLDTLSPEARKNLLDRRLNKK